MDLIRVVTTFDAKKAFEAGRQTNFISLEDLKKGLEIEVIPCSKRRVNKITLKIVDSDIGKKDEDLT